MRESLLALVPDNNAMSIQWKDGNRVGYSVFKSMDSSNHKDDYLVVESLNITQEQSHTSTE